jgi:predicted nucleic-acid-binding Zn-ribbon protein
MAKKKENIVDIEEYGDEGIVTKDRDLTEEEMNEILNKSQESEVEEPRDSQPPRKALVKVKCKCGKTSSVSEQIIEHGLSWSMIIGDNHFVTLSCPECESSLTLFLDEIVGDELPEESK